MRNKLLELLFLALELFVKPNLCPYIYRFKGEVMFTSNRIEEKWSVFKPASQTLPLSPSGLKNR